MKEVTDILLKAIEEGSFPGASYAIVNESGFMDLETLGYFRLFPEKELNRDDVIYDVASLTKVISTTTMIMKLIEDGLIHLHTPVKDILPEFKHHAITVYHKNFFNDFIIYSRIHRVYQQISNAHIH